MTRWGMLFGRLVLTAAFSLLVTLALPPMVTAAPVEIQSSTILRYFQRDGLTKKDENVAPVYEYLQADFGRDNPKGLSLHLYGWGRTDLGDTDHFDEQSKAELLYGYLEYRRPFSNFNLRLGRQQVVAGTTNDTIDGLSLFTDLGPAFSLSAYGGLPVAFSTTQGRSGDRIYGGRLSHHFGGRYDIGLSYQQLTNDGDRQKQQAGVDISLPLPGGSHFAGRSTCNLESDSWGEHSYEIHAVFGNISFRPFFEKFDYRDYFAGAPRTKNPFVLLTSANEALSTFGADVIWRKFASWDLGAKAKRYTYHSSDETADYYGGFATWHGAELTQIGAELGEMGGGTAKNNYQLGRIFFYWDQPGRQPNCFISGDLLYARYDQPLYGEDASFFASLGGGERFLKNRLELKVSGDYSVDPYYTKDMRGMLVMNYRFGL